MSPLFLFIPLVVTPDRNVYVGLPHVLPLDNNYHFLAVKSLVGDFFDQVDCDNSLASGLLTEQIQIRIAAYIYCVNADHAG